MGQSFQILFLRKFPCERKQGQIKTSVKLRERWARCSDLKGFLIGIFVARVLNTSPVGLTPRIRSLHSIIDVINSSQSYCGCVEDLFWQIFAKKHFLRGEND